ncbi:hypothetical protein [Bradyrhizobium sp. th.b2]|uniref:hypothetical protein n=1 Tax=Bradyrhizobium sp. th-b2 TaxID=172088 RepID=UPI0003FDF1CF|nr:hypothetical protein [Bradyrhizobium sp. th.b2]
MARTTFDHVQGLRKAAGFKLGQRVTMLVETKGADHEDVEHTIHTNADALIECIEQLAPPQGLTFTLWIPINELEGRGIVNVFDESDGPISNFIKAKEKS